MKAVIKFVPDVTLEIEDDKEMVVMNKAITLSRYPTYCTICKKPTGTYLTSNKDKEGNIYINAKCPDCGGVAKLGQYKTGGYFWHREFEVYKPKIPTS